MRVAALHDDNTRRDFTQRSLAAIGHECDLFDHSAALLRALRRDSFDLLVLDWLLPNFSGLEVLHWVRANLTQRVPVLFVAPRSAETAVLAGLEAGADDFMLLPLSGSEFMARVGALLRRTYERGPAAGLNFGPYLLDPMHRQVRYGDECVTLKQKEFDLALFLFQNLGRLLSRQHLTQAVWGLDDDGNSRSLDTHVSRLRGKLGLTPVSGYRLTAVYGVGYRLETFRPDVSRAAAGPLPAPPSPRPTRRA